MQRICGRKKIHISIGLHLCVRVYIYMCKCISVLCSDNCAAEVKIVSSNEHTMCIHWI